MILLNALYGLIMALVAAAIAGFYFGYVFVWYEFFGIWAVWSGAHIIYDFIAHHLVRAFNQATGNDVYRG